MSDNTTHTHQQQKEYHKLTIWERVSYGFGDYANNLTFGTVRGFLLLNMTTVNAIRLGIASIIFAIVRIIN
ncbi:MFS transporter, partial [Lactococcus lactis]|nr:MFS transporter [Lactococcus lactis]